MGTRGLSIVRFRGRYYVRYNRYDSYFEGLGAEIVASVPADPEGYRKWLDLMRATYAAKERVLDQHVYAIRDGMTPDYSLFSEFVELPSELPRLADYDTEYFYIINLDHEILTMNFGIHWQLGNIPRQDDLWIRAIADGIHWRSPTISLDICPEEHMASPALELPTPDFQIGCAFKAVTPKTDITDVRQVFLTCVLAKTLIQYMDTIICFGREWSPESFPFRELAFALVSIASGQAKFHSFPAQRCNPRSCARWDCKLSHLPKSCGWLNEKWAGDCAPLLEFGSASHRPGDPPGASPAETMYWLEDVLVSLTLVVDGEAITKAVTWGIEKQGRRDFQGVVLSLFEVAFVEVFFDDGDEEPSIKISKSVSLSPLRAAYCVSTHPRERPALKPGMKVQYNRGEVIMRSNCTGSAESLRDQFPGLMSLVHFFEIAARRRAASKPSVLHPFLNPPEAVASCGTASKSPIVLLPKLQNRILDFVDNDTWKACSVVSRSFRSYCLQRFRLDDRMNIVAGPFVEDYKGPQLSFDFEDTQTEEISRKMLSPSLSSTKECNWMPVIGSDRKALMLYTIVQFEPVPGPSEPNEKESTGHADEKVHGDNSH
ncbi:hypothetical protein B0T25DRAFT_528341 [Lasiosphaeria hispida]|uniref:Uncharacterized protein n=1 Tax=Lasiosphaeria hispida TaxID=260671 RepID=A0AAJ0MKG5_9PEZI|nr:hypothetical protein B0T25DRAFT_528341 [Lasiosphaeria hispida]